MAMAMAMAKMILKEGFNGFERKFYWIFSMIFMGKIDGFRLTFPNKTNPLKDVTWRKKLGIVYEIIYIYGIIVIHIYIVQIQCLSHVVIRMIMALESVHLIRAGHRWSSCMILLMKSILEIHRKV